MWMCFEVLHKEHTYHERARDIQICAWNSQHISLNPHKNLRVLMFYGILLFQFQCWQHSRLQWHCAILIKRRIFNIMCVWMWTSFWHDFNGITFDKNRVGIRDALTTTIFRFWSNFQCKQHFLVSTFFPCLLSITRLLFRCRYTLKQCLLQNVMCTQT